MIGFPGICEETAAEHPAFQILFGYRGNRDWDMYGDIVRCTGVPEVFDSSDMVRDCNQTPESRLCLCYLEGRILRTHPAWLHGAPGLASGDLWSWHESGVRAKKQGVKIRSSMELVAVKSRTMMEHFLQHPSLPPKYCVKGWVCRQ